MAYTPSLSDLDEESPVRNTGGYSPSLQDLEEPEQQVSAKNTDRIGLYDVIPKRPTASQTKSHMQGFLEELENMGIGVANLLPKVNIPKRNFAPQDEEAQKGRLGADIASFFIPGGIAGSAVKGLKYIPYGENAVNAISKFTTSKPVLNAISKIGTGAGEGALYGAALNDKDKQAEGAETGAALGGASNILSQLSRMKNPLVNALIRSSIGAGAGGFFGSENPQIGTLKGAALGAGAGAGLPYAAKSLRLGGLKPGMETLEHINAMDVMPTVEAANRLKVGITPGQSSGNPFIGKIEGSYGRTGEAAAEKTKINMEELQKQKGAIKDLMDTIYDKSKASKQKISDLYNQANKWNLKSDVVEKFKQDPVIEQAFKRVESDPAYRRKLQGIPDNNYAYLNQVNRALNDMEGSALKSGEKDRAAEFRDARKQLTKSMDNSVPAYKQAREEAQKSIIRSNIETNMRKKEITGKNFFDTFLKNDNAFDKLHNDLKNVPEAQEKLRDMKLVFRNLSNLEKPSSSAYKSETGTNQNRNFATTIMDLWSNLNGSKRNLEALKFIHSDKWINEIKKIQSLKNESARKDAMTQLLGRLAAMGTIKNSQGSEKDDNFLQSSS